MGKTAVKKKQWQKQRGTELTLPSENVALCKRMRPEQLLVSGMLPDSMSAMVMEAIRTKKGLPPEEAAKIAEDPAKILEVMEFMDAALIGSVIEPKISPIPRDEEGNDLRTGEEEELFPDDVDLEDKMFIFNWVLSGSSDVTRFREEVAGNLANLQTGEGVGLPS